MLIKRQVSYERFSFFKSLLEIEGLISFVLSFSLYQGETHKQLLYIFTAKFLEISHFLLSLRKDEIILLVLMIILAFLTLAVKI